MLADLYRKCAEPGCETHFVPKSIRNRFCLRRAECDREVDEFTAIADRWGFWSDGCGELVPFCPECAKREFAPDASSSGVAPLARRRPYDSTS